jgi:hypothetical protein
MKIKTYVLAGFNIHEEKSLVYFKRKTLEGFIRTLRKSILENDLDYISIRLIKEGYNE